MPEAAVGCVFNHATILTVYLITVFYFNLWHKVEGEVGKSWSTLIILHRVNPIRDSFSLTISSPTTRIHPSPFDPTYITIPHIHRGGAIMLLFLCRGHISFGEFKQFYPFWEEIFISKNVSLLIDFFFFFFTLTLDCFMQLYFSWFCNGFHFIYIEKNVCRIYEESSIVKNFITKLILFFF